MSVLDIVQDVMGEVLGASTPSTLIGNTDPTAVRALAAAKAAGQALYRAHDWTVLHREYEFTTANGVDNYAVPDDWGRSISNTAWDRDQFNKLRGSLRPGQWQRLRSGLSASAATRFSYRLVVGPLQGSILLDPIPGAAYDLVIEYISNWWLQNAAGDGKPEFQLDANDIRMDHEVYRLGVLWRVRRALGMNYLDERNDYDIALHSAKVADLALPVTNAAPDRVLPYPNIPDGSFPGPSE